VPFPTTKKKSNTPREKKNRVILQENTASKSSTISGGIEIKQRCSAKKQGTLAKGPRPSFVKEKRKMFGGKKKRKHPPKGRVTCARGGETRIKRRGLRLKYEKKFRPLWRGQHPFLLTIHI